MDFAKHYAKLNQAQKQAVDTIDGPVMVIAGPGTGKTELLSVRAANILQKTDTLPENILCLTFTESGAAAMRSRLAEIIGRDAYKIAVHTFHSFGSEVINQNSQYFYNGASFKPADELHSYQIIRAIFDQLSFDNPLFSKLNDEYTHLADSLTTISEIKKSGLSSAELLQVLDENDKVIKLIEPILTPIFVGRPTKSTTLKLEKIVNNIRNIDDKVVLQTITPLSQIMSNSLETAISQATEDNSTKAITAWRNQWMTKDDRGDFILKSHKYQIKLRALADIYEKYLASMQAAELYDFDDMIMQVALGMEKYDDLRFNLQEKYQYIMVDEFQDTNLAQMRILYNLANNEVNNGQPNILMVGDDDQAIYSFQGAEASNIINFRVNYPKTTIIALTENYRSVPDILHHSRHIIQQGSNRLENQIADLNKELKANHQDQPDSGVYLHEAETINDEYSFIVQDIKSHIANGTKPSSITVLTRRHYEIGAFLPYFAAANIPVNYERRDNAFELAPIKLIEKLARILINMTAGNHDDVNTLLPELLAHPAWGIKPNDLWQLSLQAYNDRKRWIDTMATIPQFVPLHDWLINTSVLIADTSLEQMLDILVGHQTDTQSSDDTFISPIYNYFFSKEVLQNNPSDYLTYLEALRTIRTKLRDYLTDDQIPTLTAFIDFIDLNRRSNSTVSITRRSADSDNAVNLMTVHKSKGLEFDVVYIADAVDTMWGERARSRNPLINYPENLLPLRPAGESDDERLRLFYVAMTRAKIQLHISYSLTNASNKGTLRAGFLLGDNWQPQLITSPKTVDQLINAAELAWYQPLAATTDTNLRDLIQPMLDNYKLSVTHLHSFLDITRGGPSTFLLQNLLRFPEAKSSNASYGTAIHETMRKTHNILVATGKKWPITTILANFESSLRDQHLKTTDFDKFLAKGQTTLQTFFDQKYENFTPSGVAELDFATQNSFAGNAHLTGKLDLVNINKADRTIAVTDYKTGKPARIWQGHDENEKIKLHKYRHQLLFYKLLVENSRNYHNYKVVDGIMQFVEPTHEGEILNLNIDFNDIELQHFVELVNAVWDHIIDLNLPDISSYDNSYNGMVAFEQDLIDKNI